MQKTDKIYVAGHTGLIGSAMVRKLKNLSYGNVVTRTRNTLDLTDRKKVEEFFSQERPDCVILAAAKIGGIKANNTYPAEFIFKNLSIQNNVIDLAHRYGVKKLLFLASSCIYPKQCNQPMQEQDILTGAIEATNEPYAIAKLAGIKMCQAYHRQYAANFISVIPANVYGMNDHFDENGHVLAALIAKFHLAHDQKSKNVVIWGTGKPKREFFFVDDLADACIFLLNNYDQPEVVNLGTGKETSIAELASLIKEVVGFEGALIFDSSQPDGNPRRLLDSQRIENLGWKASTSLKKGIQLTWDWYRKNLGNSPPSTIKLSD
jgi:GDP-L-fucose synthase